jgi:hypothetical protein
VIFLAPSVSRKSHDLSDQTTGSIIVERSDANRIAYGSEVSAKQLLSGDIDPPQWAMGLIECIERRAGQKEGDGWISGDGDELRNRRKDGYGKNIFSRKAEDLMT